MFTANALPVLQKWGVEEKMVYEVFQRIVSLQKISSNSEATFKDKQSFLREKKMLTLKKERREEREASLFCPFSLHPFAICWDTWSSTSWDCKEAWDEVALVFSPARVVLIDKGDK